MASRLIAKRLSTALRPAGAVLRTTPHVRGYSNDTKLDPKSRANSIIESLPGSNIATKTGILTAGAALATVAISHELYVINEETVILASFAALVWGIVKAGGPAYRDWAETSVNKIKDVLSNARTNHIEAVQTRIDSVIQMKNVEEITSQLFQASKETAKLEAQAFEMEQRVNYVQEAKAVLDSWVRHETSERQREQKQLAESLVSNIRRQLEDSTFQKHLLNESVNEVERIITSKAQ